jgi:hypothetical protein
MSWSSLKITETTILDGLLAARGDAYTHDVDSVVGIETWAHAREIASAWDDLRRIKNEQDPGRCIAWMPRWERIYGLRPDPSATPVERRSALSAACLAEGASPRPSTLQDALRAAAPALNPTIINGTSGTATTHIKAGATIAGGITVSAEPSGSQLTWTSSIAYVCVLCVQPSWMDRATYDRQQATLDRLLEKALPATSTFGTVKDGPSGPGFFCDQVGNLDNQRLR